MGFASISSLYSQGKSFQSIDIQTKNFSAVSVLVSLKQGMCKVSLTSRMELPREGHILGHIH